MNFARSLSSKLKPVVFVAGFAAATLALTSTAFADGAICKRTWLSSLEAAKDPVGYFVNAPTDTQKGIGDLYREAKDKGAGSLVKPPKGEVRRVQKEDLAVDRDSLTPAEMAIIRRLATDNAHKISVVTSGAGLWSRGGGAVKATVPYNLMEVLGEAKVARLEYLSRIATAGSPKEARAQAGHLLPLDGPLAEKAGQQLIRNAKKELKELLREAAYHRDALTPLDMKLVNVALLSAKGKTYVPFDVWTSEQTHRDVVEYFDHFKANFRGKTFHPDPKINARIKQALKQYLAESKLRGETHLIGYQEGVKALDPNTGEPIQDTVAIGEGAGMLKFYMDKTGRTRELQRMGKSILMFDNIEVVSDIEFVLAAHLRGGKQASVVVVPEKPGYSGGNPFLVQQPDGSWSIELHEQSALPKELAKGNAYFNTNTIVYGLNTQPVYDLGYENKKDNGRQIVRVKLNAGDITKSVPTSAIGGSIGIDYENFKTFAEYAANGGKLVIVHQHIWDEAHLPHR